MLETVLVLVVLGIMTVTALPIITSVQSVNLDGASRKLEADLRYAQNLATTTGDTHGMRTTNIGGTNATYEVYNAVTNQVVEDPYDHLAMQEGFASGFSGISFAGSHDIRFDSQGNPSFINGSNEVTLRNNDGTEKKIGINSSGLISINQ